MTTTIDNKMPLATVHGLYHIAIKTENLAATRRFWGDIIGLRNIAVHAYFGVEWHTIWMTATNDVPTLRKQIVDIVAIEYPEARGDEE